MIIEFEFKGLMLSAHVSVIAPVAPYRRGTPDDWDEGEAGEIEIKSLTVDGKDAIFLLDSDFSDEIETAAWTAAKKQAEAYRADALIDAYY